MRSLGLIFVCLLLAACGTLTHKAVETLANQIQTATNNLDYPEAQAKDIQLINHPPMVDLSAYQSVESVAGRPHQRPDIAIALASSGGGYRAANLTAGVLMGLEQITDPHLKGNLLEEVDYFSTVSGGGFSVGYYLASLYNFTQRHGSGPFTPQFSFTNTMNDLPSENPLDKDYTDKLFLDDGKDQIEGSLANDILQTSKGTLTLGDIFIPKTASASQVKLPYWVSNSAIYQNATLLPFTPDVLADYKVSAYAYQQHMLPIVSYSEVPVAVGMMASASFPFAVSSTTLESHACDSRSACYLQLLDGGLVDNSGVYTALNLLRQDAAKIKILIVVDAYAGPGQPFSQRSYSPTGATLFWRVVTMGVDASRQLLKQNLSTLATNELCHGNTKNVLVIYLDLDNYARARGISTNLALTHHQQKLLWQVGQSLVKESPEFSNLLKPLFAGNTQIGQCQIRR